MQKLQHLAAAGISYSINYLTWSITQVVTMMSVSIPTQLILYALILFLPNLSRFTLLWKFKK